MKSDNPFEIPPEERRSHDVVETQGVAGRYEILCLLCGMAAIAYVQRAALSVPAKEIASDLRFVDVARDLGWVQSFWYFCYAILQLPGGWFADRVGSRTAICVLCLLWSAATLLSGFANSFWSLLVIWGLMGAAQAGAFPGAARAIGQLFTEGERARASGLLASGMAIGGALAPALTGWLLALLTPLSAQIGIDRWRLVFAVYAVPGLLWSAVFLLMVPSGQLSGSDRESRPLIGDDPPRLDWSRMLTSGSLALLCAQQFFRAAAMVFFLTWFPLYLQETRGVSLTASGILTTIAGAGGFLGSVSGGFVSDWMLRRTGNRRLSRQGLAVAGMAICAILIVVSYFIADVRSSIAVISLGAFCATFGGVSGYTVAISFGGRQTATVFSAMNMCGNFGAALFPITAGWLVDLTGNWHVMLFLFAGIMAVDSLCWAVLNPRGTLFGDEIQ